MRRDKPNDTVPDTTSTGRNMTAWEDRVLVETTNGEKIVRRDSYKYDSYTGQLIEKNIRIPETFEYDGFNQLQRATLSGKTKNTDMTSSATNIQTGNGKHVL